MEEITDIAWFARTLQRHNIRLAESDTLDLPDYHDNRRNFDIPSLVVPRALIFKVLTSQTIIL